MIKFSDHSKHVYTYDATGRKLRAEYHTPIMVVTEPQVPDMGEEMPEQEDVLMEEQQEWNEEEWEEWNEEEWEEWEMEEETEEPQPQPNEPPAPSPIGNAPPPVSGNGNEEIILPVIPGNEPVIDEVPCEVTTVDYCGDFIYVNSKLKRMLFPGGYVTFRNDSIEHPEYHFYLTDHQGNVRIVANQDGTIEQINHYYPYGGLMGESTSSDYQPYKYNGKELDRHHGLDWFDYGARWYDGISWTTPDPHAESYYDTSPYVYCADNPVKYIDPNGKDWYQNNTTKYYTWYEGKTEEIDGFTHIGGKGSVLGEFESIIDNILSGKEGLGMESIYSEGFTFDITPNDKGALIGSKERGWNFLDEFVNGTGPEFSVLLGDHPYTEAIKDEIFVKQRQKIIKSRGKKGKYTNAGRPQFYPWKASLNSPMQFIGTYRYDGYSSEDGHYINNVVTDTKSVTSLVYHIPFLKNHRRSQKKVFGTTYQFYIWRSKK